jgi:hypothetical protein
MRLVTGNRQVKTDRDLRPADIHSKHQKRTCRHGWQIPQELVTLTITDHRTGHKEFRQVWRDMENAGCPDER